MAARKKREPKRPLAPIDWKKVETMMFAGAPGTEIAGSLGIHPDTLYIRFRKEYGKGFSDAVYEKKQGGYGNVRTRQYVSAMQGNTQMLKILGEEWLGQGKHAETDGGEARTIICLTEALTSLKSKIEKLEAALLNGGSSLSGVSAEQSILHQRCTGESDQISDELGSENLMGGEAQL